MLKVMPYTRPDGSSAWCVKAQDADEPVLICDTEAEAMAYVAGQKTDSKMRVNQLRVDSIGSLRPPTETPQGYLKVDAFLTRTGVFEYRNDDGSIRRELRPPEEVFDQASLDSFSMAPVTDEHPPEFLTAKNTTDYQRGHLSEKVDREGNLMRSTMLITDAGLIQKMKSGKAQQISNGYRCDLEEKSGVTADGKRYDFIQRRIRGNHVAVLPAGRAGPEVRARMDSGADVMVSISDGENSPAPKPAVPPGVAPVDKIKIDGVEYDAGSAQAAKAQRDYQAKLDAQNKTVADALEKMKLDNEKRDEEFKKLTAAVEANKGRADAEAEKSKELEAKLKAAPGIAQAALKSRMKLESDAKIVLGKKFKFDGLEDKDIKAAVLKATKPELKLDGKHEAYIDARFDSAIEEAIEAAKEDGDDERDDSSVLVDDEADSDEAGDPSNEMTDEEMNADHKDSATAREAMNQRHRNQWKQPIGGEVAA